MRQNSMACDGCGKSFVGDALERCPGCVGPFSFHYSEHHSDADCHGIGMWRYSDSLPVRDPNSIVSLGEGNTPLLSSRQAGPGRLYWKLECGNPTGSQKDRALSVSISKARELGYLRAIIASTGSAGLSCAAYCSRGGLKCVILVPNGTPRGRLVPMQMLGASVIAVDATFSEIKNFLRVLRTSRSWFDASTFMEACPYASEGAKTISYEIVADLGEAPSWVVIPVGGGGTLYGVWRGFVELVEAGRIERTPRLAAVQPQDFDVLQRALARGATRASDLAPLARDERVETTLRNLKHSVPPDAIAALAALRGSNGRVLTVTDEEALRWQHQLAATEGIFCEPSSAAAAAATSRLLEQELLPTGASVVTLVTGSGLREVPCLEEIQIPTLAPSELLDMLDNMAG